MCNALPSNFDEMSRRQLPDHDIVRAHKVCAHAGKSAVDQKTGRLCLAEVQLRGSTILTRGDEQYVHGDWREFGKGAARYLAVTAADVTRVAQKYLVDTNLTLVTLQPGAGKPGGAK